MEDLLVDVVVSEPEVLGQISEAAFVFLPRPVEVLRRIKVISLLDDGPRGAFR